MAKNLLHSVATFEIWHAQPSRTWGGVLFWPGGSEGDNEVYYSHFHAEIILS